MKPRATDRLHTNVSEVLPCSLLVLSLWRASVQVVMKLFGVGVDTPPRQMRERLQRQQERGAPVVMKHHDTALRSTSSTRSFTAPRATEECLRVVWSPPLPRCGDRVVTRHHDITPTGSLIVRLTSETQIASKRDPALPRVNYPACRLDLCAPLPRVPVALSQTLILETEQEAFRRSLSNAAPSQLSVLPL
mmetsp:Transcript_10673/g.29630  ORF Transcript_10673/g.29630 Transcript_10673/m.29630 type:complete len:191 (+) Transcript_10673:5918-6490(+)